MVHVFQTEDRETIQEAVREIFLRRQEILPADRDARILLKPNLNSHMNALTGNTTDLRLIAAVVTALKDRGYRRITIAEGTNSGFYRNNISVIDRLKVSALAEALEVSVVDLNRSDGVAITYERGATTHVAREVLEADFLVNLPKLKTHFEVGITACLKNLMGTLVGQENKKATHQNLAANILRLNEAVKPHLHILDAVIAMEGLGPTRGTPRKLGLILAGEDPFVLDLVAARIAGYSIDEVRTLALARDRGILGQDRIDRASGIEVPVADPPFVRPDPSILARIIHSPQRQPLFFRIRATQPFPYLASTKLGGWILYQAGLRQDVFIKEEALLEVTGVLSDRCKESGTCRTACPLPLDLPRDAGNTTEGCIHCLYCVAVCPEQAIAVSGEKGFFEEQERQYGGLIPEVASGESTIRKPAP